MNKRQRKKYIKNEYPIDSIQYCINRRSCDDDCYGCSYPVKYLFRKLLRKEKLSWRGWELSENPISGVYIFFNAKKNKEITLYYFPETGYEITVFDLLNQIDIHMDSITEAIHSHYQNDMYGYIFRIGTKEEREKNRKMRRIKKYHKKIGRRKK